MRIVCWESNSKLFLLIGLFVVVLLAPKSVFSATLYFSPNDVEMYRGDTISVSVRLDVDEGECVNTVDATVNYGDVVRAIDVSRGDSILSLWLEDPVINETKKNGGRIIAVGTTTLRTLESAASLHSEHTYNTNSNDKSYIQAASGETDIFIYPGYKFKIVDILITNFHLPKSTLLMLVSAFVNSTNFTLDCYKKAVDQNYRFYSFGDAMFIF